MDVNPYEPPKVSGSPRQVAPTYRLRSFLKAHPKDIGYIVFFSLVGAVVGLSFGDGAWSHGPEEQIKFQATGLLLGALAGAVLGKFLAVNDW